MAEARDTRDTRRKPNMGMVPHRYDAANRDGSEDSPITKSPKTTHDVGLSVYITSSAEKHTALQAIDRQKQESISREDLASKNANARRPSSSHVSLPLTSEVASSTGLIGGLFPSSLFTAVSAAELDSRKEGSMKAFWKNAAKFCATS